MKLDIAWYRELFSPLPLPPDFRFMFSLCLPVVALRQAGSACFLPPHAPGRKGGKFLSGSGWETSVVSSQVSLSLPALSGLDEI